MYICQILQDKLSVLMCYHGYLEIYVCCLLEQVLQTAFARVFESMCARVQMSDPVKHLLAPLCPWRKKLPICCGNSLAHADQINRFSVLKAGQDPEKH